MWYPKRTFQTSRRILILNFEATCRCTQSPFTSHKHKTAVPSVLMCIPATSSLLLRSKKAISRDQLYWPDILKLQDLIARTFPNTWNNALFTKLLPKHMAIDLGIRDNAYRIKFDFDISWESFCCSRHFRVFRDFTVCLSFFGGAGDRSSICCFFAFQAAFGYLPGRACHSLNYSKTSDWCYQTGGRYKNYIMYLNSSTKRKCGMCSKQ